MKLFGSAVLGRIDKQIGNKFVVTMLINNHIFKAEIPTSAIKESEIIEVPTVALKNINELPDEELVKVFKSLKK